MISDDVETNDSEIIEDELDAASHQSAEVSGQAASGDPVPTPPVPAAKKRAEPKPISINMVNRTVTFDGVAYSADKLSEVTRAELTLRELGHFLQKAENPGQFFKELLAGAALVTGREPKGLDLWRQAVANHLLSKANPRRGPVNLSPADAAARARSLTRDQMTQCRADPGVVAEYQKLNPETVSPVAGLLKDILPEAAA